MTYHIVSDADLTCIRNCPIEFWENGATRTCEPCHQNCLDCRSEIETDCLICKDGFFLNPDFSCKNTCPDTYWGHEDSKT